MFFNYFQVFIAPICLIVNALSQLLIFRTCPKLGLLKSELLGFVIGSLTGFLFEFCVFSIHIQSIKNFTGIFFVNVITYLSLSNCYFHFVNLGETARRVRILRELYDSQEGLSQEQILKVYNAKEIIEKRIHRLTNSRQVIYKNGKYYIGNQMMLCIAKIIVKMKLIFLGIKSELILP